MKSLITVLKEQFSSFYLINRLALFEIRIKNSDNYLGMLWEIINPLIQISVYWFVFGFGIRSNRGMEVGDITVPFIFWMLAGITMWFFVNQATMDATKSIYQRINIIAKMNFPMSAIPSYIILSKFYPNLLLFMIIGVIFQFGGFPISIYYLQIPYYMICGIALVFSFTLITSTLATIVRDVVMMVQSLMRILFYISGILWAIDGLPEPIQSIIKLNPLLYIAEGYRSAFLSTGWYLVDHFTYTLYFWGLIFVFLLIGSILHVKFRSRFVDFL
ncbi:ABC transporter permease [Bacillus kwashiorkori]|uniref:ABC transporter permease n=1 Tax=Bacillus kwashiorkori TaxID=1522318 RepID=UPI000785FE51|nr:ABC transporter permease [Bacillus kwashiorkori]